MAEVKPVTDDQFDEVVLASDKPVVVDFWAEWCGPCRQVSPVLEELATDYAGHIEFVKLNVDENPQTPMRYRVTGLPTIHVFVDGEIAESIVGAQPKATIRAKLAELAPA